jgi:hypothetical protein
MRNDLLKRPEFIKLNKADPDILLNAVAVVQAKFEAENRKPGAEKWQADTRKYRPLLVAEIVAEWERISGCDEVFPWHEDYVLDVWVSFRKMKDQQKQLMWEHFGVSVHRKEEATP